jgi:ribonuclease D
MLYLTATGEIPSLNAKYTTSKNLWIYTEVADYKSRNPRLSLIQILDNRQEITGDSIYIFAVLEHPNMTVDFIERVMSW